MEPKSAQSIAMKDLASSNAEEDQPVHFVFKKWDYVVIHTTEEDVSKFMSALKDLKTHLSQTSLDDTCATQVLHLDTGFDCMDFKQKCKKYSKQWGYHHWSREMEPKSAMKDLPSSNAEEDQPVLFVFKKYEDYVVIDTI